MLKCILVLRTLVFIPLRSSLSVAHFQTATVFELLKEVGVMPSRPPGFLKELQRLHIMSDCMLVLPTGVTIH